MINQNIIRCRWYQHQYVGALVKHRFIMVILYLQRATDTEKYQDAKKTYSNYFGFVCVWLVSGLGFLGSDEK